MVGIKCELLNAKCCPPPQSLEFSSRLYALAAAAALWRYGVRLGASRQYHERNRGLAGAAFGGFSFSLSTDGAGSVSRDDGELADRIRGIHLRRCWIGQRANPADGFGISLQKNYGSGVDCGAASGSGGEHSRVQVGDPALFAD